MFARNNIYFRLRLLLIIIHITCISLSLHRTSAPIHLTSLLGVLGTRETSWIIIAGLLERDTFDLFLPEFDKPWVIHLSETYCCSTNLCTWRPNTIKNRSVHRHQSLIFSYSFFSTYFDAEVSFSWCWVRQDSGDCWCISRYVCCILCLLLLCTCSYAFLWLLIVFCVLFLCFSHFDHGSCSHICSGSRTEDL
jgi:hypothetical protein